MQNQQQVKQQVVSSFSRKQITRLIDEAWLNYERAVTELERNKWAEHAFDLLAELPENEVTLKTAH